MAKILLNGLEFYAFHGVYPEERKIGGKYKLDIELVPKEIKAVVTDELSDTINYAEVYKVISEEMRISSKLIEHVAGRIINSLFVNFKNLESVKIVLSKINPPIGAKIDDVSVIIEQKRK